MSSLTPPRARSIVAASALATACPSVDLNALVVVAGPDHFRSTALQQSLSLRAEVAILTFVDKLHQFPFRTGTIARFRAGARKL